MKQHRFLYLNPYLRYLMLMNVALKKDIEDAYNRDTNIINFTLGEAVPSSKNNNQNSQNSTEEKQDTSSGAVTTSVHQKCCVNLVPIWCFGLVLATRRIKATAQTEC